MEVRSGAAPDPIALQASHYAGYVAHHVDSLAYRVTGGGLGIVLDPRMYILYGQVVGPQGFAPFISG